MKTAGISRSAMKAASSLHVGSAGFGGGADALQSAHFKAVGIAEVAEGVMGGDEYALVFGNAFGLFLDVGVQFFQLCEIGGGVGFVVGGVLRVEFDTAYRERPRRLCIHRVTSNQMWGSILVAVVCPRQKQAVVNAFAHGGDRLALAQLFEYLGHLRLQEEAVVEDDFGVLEQFDVAFGGDVEVWVDARAHEAGDIDVFAADDLGNIGELADGGDDANAAVLVGSVLRGCAASARAEGERGDEGEEDEGVSVGFHCMTPNNLNKRTVPAGSLLPAKLCLVKLTVLTLSQT